MENTDSICYQRSNPNFQVKIRISATMNFTAYKYLKDLSHAIGSDINEYDFV